jgi:hypothetical protein
MVAASVSPYASPWPLMVAGLGLRCWWQWLSKVAELELRCELQWLSMVVG